MSKKQESKRPNKKRKEPGKGQKESNKMMSNAAKAAREWCNKGLNAIGSLFDIDKQRTCLSCNKPFSTSSVIPLQLMFCDANCYIGFTKNQRLNNGQCLMPGCERPRGRNRANGVLYDYCTLTHARAHDEELHRSYYHDDLLSYTKSYCSYTFDYLPERQPILFYDRDKPFYEFTNFASYSIIVDDHLYMSTEHYFQSQKLVGTPYERHIAMLPRARDAFEFPRKPLVAEWVRKDWAEVKEDVMLRGLYCKFTQYPRLKKLLLKTGKRELIEDSPHDSYWGIGRDRNGQNRLGKLLMRLREILRGTVSNPDHISTDGQSNAGVHNTLSSRNDTPHMDPNQRGGSSHQSQVQPSLSEKNNDSNSSNECKNGSNTHSHDSNNGVTDGNNGNNRNNGGMDGNNGGTDGNNGGTDGNNGDNGGNNSGTNGNNGGMDGNNGGTDGSNGGTDGNNGCTDGSNGGTDGNNGGTNGNNGGMDGNNGGTEGNNGGMDGNNGDNDGMDGNNGDNGGNNGETNGSNGGTEGNNGRTEGNNGRTEGNNGRTDDNNGGTEGSNGGTDGSNGGTEGSNGGTDDNNGRTDGNNGGMNDITGYINGDTGANNEYSPKSENEGNIVNDGQSSANDHGNNGSISSGNNGHMFSTGQAPIMTSDVTFDNFSKTTTTNNHDTGDQNAPNDLNMEVEMQDHNNNTDDEASDMDQN